MKHTRKYIRSAFLFLPCAAAALLLCLAAGCSRRITPVSRTDFYFDTVVTLTLYPEGGEDAAKAEELFQGCFALCGRYEDMLSRTRKGSDIWRLNHAQGAPVEVDPETARLLQKALYYCRETDGALDITIAPVSALWDFHADPDGAAPAIPQEEAIQSLLPHVDYRNVRIDGNTVTLTDPQAAVDLGCAAKGYIADRLRDYLRAQGVTSAVINLGGNVVAIGKRPDGSAFRLGIRRPFDQNGAPIAALDVSDASLVSSGVYERYFEKDGRRYHHLLDPATGMPEDNGLLSVTILSESSADGDILSTACFLLGLKQGMDYIESLPGIEAVFITEDYALHASSGLSGSLQTP